MDPIEIEEPVADLQGSAGLRGRGTTGSRNTGRVVVLSGGAAGDTDVLEDEVGVEAGLEGVRSLGEGEIVGELITELFVVSRDGAELAVSNQVADYDLWRGSVRGGKLI